MLSTPVIHVNVWITTHLPTLGEWKALLVTMSDILPTEWSPVNHRLGAGQGKSADQRPTS